MLIDHSAQILTSSTTAFKEECTRLQAAGVIKRMQGTVGLLDMSSQAVKLEYFSGGDEDSRGHYVGVGGMDHIAAHLADEIIQGGGQFVRPAWVSAMKQPQDKSTKNAESNARRWLLSNKGQWTDTAEAFEYVVIAHNGKCADNLLKKTIPPGETLSFIFLVFFLCSESRHNTFTFLTLSFHSERDALSLRTAPAIHRLLRVNFGAELPLRKPCESESERQPQRAQTLGEVEEEKKEMINPKMTKMQLCSLWACSFVLHKDATKRARVGGEGGSINIDSSTRDHSGSSSSSRSSHAGHVVAAHVKGSPVLSWICNTSRKHGGGCSSGSGGVVLSPRLPSSSSGSGSGESAGSDDSDWESWTLLSTAEYAAANKCPQENIPPSVYAKVRVRYLNHPQSPSITLNPPSSPQSPSIPRCKKTCWRLFAPVKGSLAGKKKCFSTCRPPLPAPCCNCGVQLGLSTGTLEAPVCWTTSHTSVFVEIGFVTLRQRQKQVQGLRRGRERGRDAEEEGPWKQPS
jgi:hypothetical protein